MPSRGTFGHFGFPPHQQHVLPQSVEHKCPLGGHLDILDGLILTHNGMDWADAGHLDASARDVPTESSQPSANHDRSSRVRW
eukprot:1189632-Prorocentrum_minimum.AAC.1